MNFLDPEVDAYARHYGASEDPILRAINQETIDHVEMSQMLSGESVGSFLRFLLKIHGAKKVLEIGTYVGYSALSMACAIPEDGTVTTCDSDKDFIEIARKNFARHPAGQKIDIKFGLALDTLKSLNSTFDFVFIDADKENYLNYYKSVLPLVRPGGIICVDNCLWSGRVLRPTSADDIGIHELNEFVSRDERVENIILTVRDGLHLLRKID